MRIVFALLLPLIFGCRVYESIEPAKLEDTGPDTSDSGEPPGDTDDTSDTSDTGEPDPVWDEAMLSILAPSSGAFVPLGESASFEAMVYDSEGNDLGWDAIDWSSNADGDWAFTAASFEDDSLSVGKHDITASTQLPNGDRLAMTVGDVLVQSPYAGTYTGTVYTEITIEYNKVPYTVSCAGATTIVVDAEGQAAVGESSCLVSLMGYDMDLALSLDATNDEGDLDGEMAVSMVLFDVGIAATGSVSEDGALEMSFADDVYGYAQIAGSVDADRLSRDTELSD
jgi:hypothetical protein